MMVIWVCFPTRPSHTSFHCHGFADHSTGLTNDLSRQGICHSVPRDTACLRMSFLLNQCNFEHFFYFHFWLSRVVMHLYYYFSLLSTSHPSGVLAILFIKFIFSLIDLYDQGCHQSFLSLPFMCCSFYLSPCSHLPGFLPYALSGNSSDDFGGGWGATHWTYDPGRESYVKLLKCWAPITQVKLTDDILALRSTEYCKPTQPALCTHQLFSVVLIVCTSTQYSSIGHV